MPHNGSNENVSDSDQNRREYMNDEESDDSVGMGLDSAPSPSNFVTMKNEVQNSDEVMSDTTPTTPPSGTSFFSKTNYSSWRDEYPCDGLQVSPLLLVCFF